ncbi:MAG: hypothetical protein SFU56_16675, partial [Capsulimonadales bacterium]|nr:hypothetical protein [Capsulimonadales bacterium]
DDRAAVLEKLPRDTGTGAGTNIRRPHHEVLKLIAREPDRPAYIVVLSDSYNDEPKSEDPAYRDYLRYYVPGGQLSKYPNTSENADYERLLRELVVSGKVRQFGIGVGFNEMGRPIERLPQSAPKPEPVPTVAPVSAVSKPAENPSPLLWIVLGLAGIAAVGGLVFFLSAAKPMALRISNGPKEMKDFQVRAGQPVRIGGEGARFAPDAFPIAELKSAVVVIRPGRGGLTAAPASQAMPGGKSDAAAPPPGNETSKVRVLLNGLPLEAESPVGYGDELRIAITPAAGGVAREYRLKLTDPKNI